jgi:hypothetical protein
MRCSDLLAQLSLMVVDASISDLAVATTNGGMAPPEADFDIDEMPTEN